MKQDVLFENKRRGQIKKAAENDTLILLPVGILEEHGPHLPINTDNIIAYEIARRVAEKLNDKIPTLVMPTVWAGYHGKELADIPGGIRVMPETLYHYVYDICESLVRNGFRKIAMINGHGQNPAILELVTRKIADEFGVHMMVTYPLKMIGSKAGLKIKHSPEGGAGGHAGEEETALILALQEELVDMSLAPEGDRCRHRTKFFGGDLFPEHETMSFGYYSTWAVQGSRSGVLGEPKYATKEEGEKFLELIIKNYVELMKEFYELEPQKVTGLD